MKISRKNVPYMLAAAGTLIYISLIFNNNLWMDEAFTAVLVKGSFSSMIRGSISDTLPPLYNIFLWTMTHIFGYCAPVMKLTSVIPMILILLLGCTAVRRDFGPRTSMIFILCMMTVPELYHYGVEIRMYSLGLLFSTAAAVYAYECLHAGTLRSWILLTASTVLAGYTHQFALIAAFFVWIYLFIFILKSPQSSHGLFKKFFLSGICTAVLYIPCLAVTFFQLKNASGYFSAARPSFSGYMSSLRYPFATDISPVSVLLLAAFLFVMFFGQRALFAFLYSVTYIFILSLSYIIMLITGSPFFSGRYLIPAFGILWLGFAVNAGGEWHLQRIPQKLLCATIAVILLSSGAACYYKQFIAEYDTGVDEMTDFFRKNLSADDGYLIFENNYQIELCMRYYEPSLKKYDWDTADRISGNIWYFEVPGFEKELDYASAHGYNIEYIGDMSFDMYSFKLYRLHRVADN